MQANLFSPDYLIGFAASALVYWASLVLACKKQDRPVPELQGEAGQ